MSKKTLIAIAVVAMLAVAVQAHDPWPVIFEPKQVAEIPVLMPIVRWAEVTALCDHINVEQITDTDDFEGCCDLEICNNFAPMDLTATITTENPGGDPFHTVAQEYLIDLSGPVDPWHSPSDTTTIYMPHLTGDLAHRTVCVKLEDVDMQAVEYRPEKIQVAWVIITVVPVEI